MTEAVVTAPAQVVPKRQRSWTLGMALAVGWLALVVVVSILAPVLPFIDDPTSPSRPLAQNAGPSWDHWFGTDDLARDVFARVIHGGRLPLAISSITITIGIVLGGLLGLVAGFFRGWVDQVVGAAMSILLSFPALILVLFIVTVRGQSFWNVTLALCVISVPAIARIVRAQTIRYAEREFVTAARAMGARSRRLIFSEVLPNVVPAMVSFAFLALGLVIIAEGGLSLIGKSVPAPSITWGGIISAGKGELRDAPHVVLFPALMIFVTVLALNHLGDQLLRRLDVREAKL